MKLNCPPHMKLNCPLIFNFCNIFVDITSAALHLVFLMYSLVLLLLAESSNFSIHKTICLIKAEISMKEF